MRERVRDALRAARGDDARTSIDRRAEEIDAFLGARGRGGDGDEDGARGTTTTTTTKRERVDDEGTPTDRRE